MGHLELFAKYRTYLYALAYSTLGSAADVEDLLQETFLRWQQTALDTIKSPKAFLATVLRHLCLNQLQSARVRREGCLEQCAEQPADNRFSDPERAKYRKESLAIALRIMVERLPPKERLVLLLREVFEYEYEEIAAIIRKNSTNCRQLFRRAKQHLTSEGSRFTVSPEELARLTCQFTQTSTNGDLEGLISLLSYS
jgi:RNA polymerase sigma-70 factor (ECF subfamily)